MKRNTLYKLQDKITLLEVNGNAPRSTTAQRFSDIVNTRAFIRSINGQEDGIFDVIVPMLTILRGRTFTGIRWNNTEYECITSFKEYDTGYLKGTVRSLPAVVAKKN
ncbi:MAG: hypothetical protein LBC25_02715 [Holosporales bacterium]|jgi:hypothetical protein|nr:hypothetical protein [Holosporales bacterium]